MIFEAMKHCNTLVYLPRDSMLVFQSLRKMNVISSECLKEDSISSATYTIVIDDFRQKLAMAAEGESSITQEISVNWSKFAIMVYIAGRNEESQGYLSLYIYNRSDWMVRARHEISVKVKK